MHGGRLPGARFASPVKTLDARSRRLAFKGIFARCEFDNTKIRYIWQAPTGGGQILGSETQVFFFSGIADKMNIRAISCSNRHIFCVLADWILRIN